MKKFKKALALSLTLAMGMSMVACGDKKDATTGAAATTEAAKTEGTTAASSEAKTDAPTEAQTEAQTEAPTEAQTEAIPENVTSGADLGAADTFVVWGWNDDVKNIIDNVYGKDESKAANYARIAFVNAGGSGYYQTKIDPILQKADDQLYPDMMALEIDYVQKYVQSGELMSMADLGITNDDLANQYDFNAIVCSDNGTVGADHQYASFWQATPGGWCLRADLCEKFLGTKDVAQLTEMFSTWEKVEETAAKVSEASGGTCRLLSGWDDLIRVYMNHRTSGWYNSDDVITIDDQVKAYFEEAKKFADNNWTFNTEQWSADWNSMMEGDGSSTNAALAYTGCPWFLYWCLKDSWKGQTIVVPGPQSYYWGGTGLAITKNCSDKDLGADLIKYITCDEASMVKIAELNSDYLNNKAANATLTANASDALKSGNGFMNSQNYLEVFNNLLANMTVDTSIVVPEDKACIDSINNYVKEYIKNGDYDTAINNFKSFIHDTFNYLKVE